jgi:hypothetical protein
VPLLPGGGEEVVVITTLNVLPSMAEVHRDRTGQPRHLTPNVADPLVLMRDGDAVGAGDGASGVVDREVVAMELVGAQVRVAGQWPRLDHRGVTSSSESGRSPDPYAESARTCTPGSSAEEQVDAGRAVTGVGGGEIAGSDQPGVGFDRDVGFVAVAIVRPGLVHVTGLGIDRRDHPVLGDTLGDPPRAFGSPGFDVLASDQREQTDQLLLVIIESDIVNASSTARASLTSR